jgi:hypothetical protein
LNFTSFFRLASTSSPDSFEETAYPVMNLRPKLYTRQHPSRSSIPKTQHTFSRITVRLQCRQVPTMPNSVAGDSAKTLHRGGPTSKMSLSRQKRTTRKTSAKRGSTARSDTTGALSNKRPSPLAPPLKPPIDLSNMAESLQLLFLMTITAACRTCCIRIRRGGLNY